MVRALRGLVREVIPGIFNYCDRWCSRCFQRSVCGLYADMHGICDRTSLDSRELPDWLSDALTAPVTEDEEAAVTAFMDRRKELTEQHPACRLAREYAAAVWRLALSLRDDAMADPVASMAWDSVRTLSFTIRAKTTRAIHQVVDQQLEKDRDDRTLDPRGVQTDGNGSAKISRLMIRESREGWITLARTATPLANWAADMIRSLDNLDAELVTAFPWAMEFRRPGFDD